MSQHKIHVCFVCMGDWGSTLCLRAKSFGESLIEAGYEASFLLPMSEANSQLATENKRIHLIPTRITKFLVAARKAIKTIQPTHVHFLNPEFKATALSCLLPGQTVIGDWEDWHAVSRDKGLRSLVTKSCDAFMRRRSNIVITASNWLADEFHSRYNIEASYIPYATLPREFPDLENPFERPTAVFMGSFHLNWDHDILIDAAIELKRRGQKPNILLIGRGHDLDRCQKVIDDHGLTNVRFSGYLDWDDMLNRLQWAHLLVFPIRDKIANRARCPFKVFQYAQARRPILTCRVGEVPTFLNEQAIYVDSDASSFADQISQVMSQPRLPDVDYGIDQHTWESRGNDLIRVLNQA